MFTALVFTLSKFMIRKFIVVFLTIYSLTCFATDEKTQLTKEYAAQQAEIAVQASESYANLMAPQLGVILKQKNPKITQVEIDQILKDLSLILREQVYESGFYEEIFCSLYGRFFTLEELRSIVSFNNSPAGKKLLEVTVPLAIESEKLAATLIKQRLPMIIESLKNRAKEKGLEVEI